MGRCTAAGQRLCRASCCCIEAFGRETKLTDAQQNEARKSSVCVVRGILVNPEASVLGRRESRLLRPLLTSRRFRPARTPTLMGVLSRRGVDKDKGRVSGAEVRFLSSQFAPAFNVYKRVPLFVRIEAHIELTCSRTRVQDQQVSCPPLTLHPPTLP